MNNVHVQFNDFSSAHHDHYDVDELKREDSVEIAASKLVRQGTPRLTEKKTLSKSTQPEEDDDDDDDDDEGDNESNDANIPPPNLSPNNVLSAPLSSPSPSSSPSALPSASPPLPKHFPPSSTAHPIASCLLPTVICDDGIPRCIPRSLAPHTLQRSVSDPTHIPIEKRKCVRFVTGSGGSRESDKTDSSDNLISPHDIRRRGIPEEHHYVYRLLDPDDDDITYRHVNDHPEIWTKSILQQAFNRKGVDFLLTLRVITKTNHSLL